MKNHCRGVLKFCFGCFFSFVFCISNVNAIEVSTYQELSDCMSTPGEVCDVTQDITMSSYIVTSANTTLNLNNHRLDGENYLIVAFSGSTTVNGPGTLESTNSNNSAPIYISGWKYDEPDHVTVSINNVTILNGDGWAAYINNRDKNSNNIYPAYGATLNLDGCTISALDGVTILGNFQDVNAVNPPAINIKNTSFEVTEVALYAAGYGIYTVENSTLKGNGAVGVKSGTVTIKNSKINGIGEYIEDVNSWNNGIRSAGAGIQIELNDNYADHVRLIIENTEVTSLNGRAFQQYSSAGSSISEIQELSLKNCKFSSPRDNIGVNELFTVTKFIEGGEYSNLPEPTYLKDGLKAYQSNSKHVYVIAEEEELVVEKAIVLTVGDTVALHENTADFVGYSVDYDENTTEEELEELRNIVTVDGEKGTITGKNPGTVVYHVYLNDDAALPNIPEKVVTIVVLPEAEVVSTSQAIDSEEVINDDTATILNEQIGSALKEVITAEDEDLDELGLAVKNAVLSGEVVSAQITIDAVETDEVDDEIVSEVEKNIKGDTKLIAYYDITIDVLIDGDLAGNIDELDKELKITLPVPENLPEVPKGKIRVFTVIRVHGDENETTEIKATDNGDGTITFGSDKYSTFALTYTDVDQTPIDDTPNTGTIATLGIVLMLISGGALVVVRSRKYLK